MKKVITLVVCMMFLSISGSLNFVENSKAMYDNDQYLIANWNFDDDYNNTIYDSSDNNYNADNSGCSYLSGVDESGLEIVETDIVRNISSSFDDSINDKLSIACWIKWYGEHPDTYCNSSYIFDCREDSYDGGGFILRLKQEGLVEFTTIELGTNQEIESKSAIIPNIWTHIAVVFDNENNELKMFINGIEENSTTTYKSYSDSDYNAVIGNNHWAPNDDEWAPLNGIIDNLYIYNKALSDSDIYSLYDSNYELSSDIVGDWSFDETNESTVIDQSGYKNHGTIYGATRTNNGVDGTIGLEFDGDNDKIYISDDPSLNFHNSNELTLSIWVKRGRMNANHSEKLISKSTTAYNKGYGLTIKSNNTLVFGIRSENEYFPLYSNQIIDTDWHHIVATWKNGIQSLFIDGQLDAAQYNGNYTIADDHKTLELGVHYSSNQDYKGIMDELRIYKKALTEEEIQNLYSSYQETYNIVTNNKTEPINNETEGIEEDVGIPGFTTTLLIISVIALFVFYRKRKIL